MVHNRFTEFGIVYDLSDTTASSESNIVTYDNKDFGDVENLKNDEPFDAVMTLEHNYTVLDESLPEFTGSIENCAFFSDHMSDEDGLFENNPKLVITFAHTHESYSFMFYFVEKQPMRVKVDWYFGSESMCSREFDIDSDIMTLDQEVPLYNRMEVEFLQTYPMHYIKLYYIRYGIKFDWDEKKVKKASLTQEMNRISTTIPINSLSFDIIDMDKNIDPANSKGMHQYFQRNQAMYPYEYVNGEKKNLGAFFLDTFSYSTDVGKIKAFSVLGLLDYYQFDIGEFYNGITAGTVIAQIFNVCHISNYVIDEVTSNQLLYGTIIPCTCRNALQQVLFACQSVIDTSDIENIRIFKTTSDITEMIMREQKLSTSVKVSARVSGVKIEYNRFEEKSDDGDPTKLVDGTFDAGSYRQVFTSPYRSYAITGGTITSYGVYFVEFTVDADETNVLITARDYENINNSVQVDLEVLPPGETENVKVHKTSLCNFQTAKILATKLLKYYQDSSLEITAKHLTTHNRMDDVLLVENGDPNFGNYLGGYTKRTFDLTGGFVDTATVIGRYQAFKNDYYALEDGSDLKANDNILI